MEEYKFKEFFSRHFWKLISALFAVCMIFVFFNRHFSSKDSEKKQDFLTIKNVFESIEKGRPLSKESLDMAETILKRYPELHIQYDTLMAISFASIGNIEKMNAFVLPQKDPFYDSFAKTTLLINKEDFQAALQNAQKLEEQLKEKNDFNILRSFNLLRIAFLSKKLNLLESQSQAIKTLETLKTYPKIAHLFEEGTFTLKDFFNH